MPTKTLAEWISAREFARRLDVCIHSVRRIAEANGIRRKVIPGTFTKYHRGDVESLAARCVVDAPEESRDGARPSFPGRTAHRPGLPRPEDQGS